MSHFQNSELANADIREVTGGDPVIPRRLSDGPSYTALPSWHEWHEIALEMQAHPRIGQITAINRIKARKALAAQGNTRPISLLDLKSGKNPKALTRVLNDIRNFGKAHTKPKGGAA